MLAVTLKFCFKIQSLTRIATDISMNIDGANAVKPFLVWLAIDTFFVLIAAVLVVFGEVSGIRNCRLFLGTFTQANKTKSP